MSLMVQDNRTGGFTFTWSIHNFSYCVQKEDEFLDSPKFVANSIENTTTWFLRVYPRGNSVPGFISYYIRRDSIVSNADNCVLSIRACNGLFKEINHTQPFNLRTESKGFKGYLSHKQLNEPGAYLENDTLTFRCRMWKNEDDLSRSVNCYAHTKIKVVKIDFLWAMDSFEDSNQNNSNLTTKIPTSSTEIPCFTVHLFNGGAFGDDTIHFAVEKPLQTNKLFLICMIHLLDGDGGIAHSVRGEYLFRDSNVAQIWNFPFLSRRKLLSKEDLYLTSGLTLRCEFSVSNGEVINEVERFEYGRTDYLPLKTSSHTLTPDLPTLWKENMQKCYQEGKFSDVTVQTPGKHFPVHKAILCAQSEVFSAMFERDMKENLTGVVEIADLEDDTVSKMLMFLYTDSIEDLDFSTACKLYFAADKYRIAALHRKCLNYLVHSLDTSNVCDVLVLADTHQDQELKSTARDFILVHDQEIINSEHWQELMEAKAHLTNETMQFMICNKILGPIVSHKK